MRLVQPGHHAHQRGLAGLGRAQQHGDRVGHEHQVERVQQALRPRSLFDAFEHQFHEVSGVGVTAAPSQCSAHQAATAARSAAL